MRNGVLLPIVVLALAVGGCVSWEVDQEGPSRFLVAAGQHDSAAGAHAVAGRVQYTHEPIARGLRLTGGVDASARQSVYAHAGMSVDIRIEEDWVFSPNLGFGYYHRGDGAKLGGSYHFRNGGSISYLFDGWRGGLGWHHISNLGMRDSNPGQEHLMLQVEIPLGGSPDD
jgi:hypothetical protein